MEKPLPVDDAYPIRATVGRRVPDGLAGLFLGLVLGLAAGAAIAWALRGDQNPDFSIQGPGLAVRYTIRTSPSSTMSADIPDVERIDLRDGYVAVRTGDGSGRVLFGESTQELTWSTSPPVRVEDTTDEHM